MSASQRRLYRILNALFWIVVYAGVVVWSETWGNWFAMVIQAAAPLILWGYIHLVLRPGGSAGAG